jgi:Spy/CpxP family protein refolding chaperone
VYKKLIFPIITFLLCFNAFGQRDQDGKLQERIKAQKVAFITDRLELTSDEAQKFWPIYNAFEDKTNALRNTDLRELRSAMKKENLSEREAQAVLDKFMAYEDKMYQSKKQLIIDLGKAIPPQKIIALKSAEDAFNRMLMERLKQRRDKMQEMKKNRN